MKSQPIPKDFQYLLYFALAFNTIVLVSNVVGAKVIEISHFVLPVGVFIFPISYVLNAVMSELYGFNIARRIILSGMLANIFLAAFTSIAIALPSASTWTGQPAFAETLGASNQIVLGSLLSFCVGELVNSKIITKLKARWQSRYFSLRAVMAVVLAEALGTTLMISVGFWGRLAPADLLNMGIIYYGFKMFVFILAIPFVAFVVKNIQINFLKTQAQAS